jgi:hypothetical protein
VYRFRPAEAFVSPPALIGLAVLAIVAVAFLCFLGYVMWLPLKARFDKTR